MNRNLKWKNVQVPWNSVVNRFYCTFLYVVKHNFSCI